MNNRLIKKIPMLVALVLAPHMMQAKTTDSGKSFFSPQPLASVLEPLGGYDYLFSRTPLEVAEEGNLSVSVMPFYMKSTNGKDLRRLFFPGRKDAIVIKGSEAGGSAPDVSGTWLQIAGYDNSAVAIDPNGINGDVGDALNNQSDPLGKNPANQEFRHKLEMLYNQYSSTFSLKPEYVFSGVRLQCIKKYPVGPVEAFFECSLPIGSSLVHHNMRETNILGAAPRLAINPIQLDSFFEDTHNPGDYIYTVGRAEKMSDIYATSAIEAFSNKNRMYGKLSEQTLIKQGIGDFKIKLGIGGEHWSLYAKSTLPTAEKPTNEYMFESLMGNGGNAGLGAGIGLRFGQSRDNFAWDWHFMSEFEYLFEATQMRTYDLTNNGEWSRYLLMLEYYKASDFFSAPTNAANLLTLKTKVTPGVDIQLGTQVSLSRGGFTLGFNYAFSCQGEEQLRICENFHSNFNIASLQLLNGTTSILAGNTFSADEDLIFFPKNFLPDAVIKDFAGQTLWVPLQNDKGAKAILIAAIAPILQEDLANESARQAYKSSSNLGISGSFALSIAGEQVTCSLGYNRLLSHEKTSLEGWIAWCQLNINI